MKAFTPLYSSVADLVVAWQEKVPEKEALVFVDVESGAEQRTSYRELATRVVKAANYLWQKGVRKGDRVAFLLENNPDILVLELAAGLLGASSVPLDAKRDTPERKDFKLKDAGCKVCFEKEDSLSVLTKDQPEEPQFSSSGSLENEYILLYTSGTTGNPKGVPLTLLSCMAGAEGIIAWQELVATDRFQIVLPLHHVNSTILSFATLLVGAMVVLHSRYSASRFWELVEEHGATHTSVVPTIVHDLLARQEEWHAAKHNISCLKRILIGSAPVLAAETLRFCEAFGVSTVQGYGQTETALRVTGVPVDLPKEQAQELVRQNSIGAELAYSNVRILRDDDTEALEEEEGEICIRGPVVTAGYLNNAEENAKAFRNDWFHSGDLGYWKEVFGQKHFFIKGRLKEIIIKGGVNISPAAVEDAILKAYPEVEEVCVVGYEDERMGEEIAVVIRGPEDMNIQEVPGLSSYEWPQRVFHIKEELPKTSTGKIKRVEVKEMVKQWIVNS